MNEDRTRADRGAFLTRLAVGVCTAVLSCRAVAAQTTSAAADACDPVALAAGRGVLSAFDPTRLAAPRVVTPEQRAAASEYVKAAEACYQAMYAAGTPIDSGGLLVNGGAESFNIDGRKWGGGRPYEQVPGGIVTFSFMSSLVPLGSDTKGTGLAIEQLPTFQACFLREIRQAFAAWSAVANIQFVEVADDGEPFDTPGASGDIRIVAHPIDGGGGTLAHAYYPPPNGNSAAGDLHFDALEQWSCTPGFGAIDIGIVAAHEVGHSIGLGHATYTPPGRPALMTPGYFPPRAAPFVDDVMAAVAIYGPSRGRARGRGNDLVMADATGVRALLLGYGWQGLYDVAPDLIATGDADGAGNQDLIIKLPSTDIFGYAHFLNEDSWQFAGFLAADRIVTADLNGDGYDEVIANVPGAGVLRSIYTPPWSFTWTTLNVSNADRIVRGDLDGNGVDDLVMDFPGGGIWLYMNDVQWLQLHVLNGTHIVTADLDGNGRDEVVVDFPGYGIWTYYNNSWWSQLHPLSATRIAAGDVDGNGRFDLTIDFGPDWGIWVRRNDTDWWRLHALSAEDMILGDLDGDGRDEIVIDFGYEWGIWAFVNDSSWEFLDGANPDKMAVADIN